MTPEPLALKTGGAPPGLRVYARALLRAALLALLLFLPAGTLAWPSGLVYLALYSAWSALNILLLARRSPALLQLREGQRPQPTEAWDKVFVFAGAPLTAALFLVCAAEGPLSAPAPALAAAAYLCICAAGALWTWALLCNPFAAGVAVLQEGQRPVAEGPYRKIRHPIYLAAVVIFLATPAALGSLGGFVPAGLLAAAVIARTWLEDRLLLSRLPGYAGYAARAPYRLLPGIW